MTIKIFINMEDEECIPENGDLKTYLESLGYWDVEVKKNYASSHNSKLDISNKICKQTCAEFLDEEIIKQIGILISTQMLFEDDIANIENVLSKFRVKKCGMLKSMFQGKFGISVMFICLLLYWFLGSYAFLIASSFYAYKGADYLWRTNYSHIRLKKLVTILHKNFNLLSKTVKFIKENNKFITVNNIASSNLSDEFKYGFDIYSNFQCDFYNSVSEMIEILCKSTQKLITKLPLYEYVESPQYYICNNINMSNYKSTDLFKLYEIYLLVQSEFLQRLVLSLIPNLNLVKDNIFQEVNRILTESCVHLLKIKNKLNKKFKYIYINGIHTAMLKGSSQFKPKVYESSYEKEFALNIHDVSNSFQNLLIKSRIIEENFKFKKSCQEIENDLIDLQTVLNFCQRNVSDGFILLKKANRNSEKKEPNIVMADLNDQNVVTEKIKVGVSDLNPEVEDEIFEAYLHEKEEKEDVSNFDDFSWEETLKRKIEFEYSKNVMKELKLKLVEKAKNWEKREAEALKKKNGFSINDSIIKEQNNLENKVIEKLSNQSKNSSPDSNNGEIAVDTQDKNLVGDTDEVCFIRHQKKFKSFVFQPQEEILKPSHIDNNLLNQTSTSDSVTDTSENSVVDHPSCYIQMISKDFLNDLSITTQKILNKNTITEQCYGDSDGSCKESDSEG